MKISILAALALFGGQNIQAIHLHQRTSIKIQKPGFEDYYLEKRKDLKSLSIENLADRMDKDRVDTRSVKEASNQEEAIRTDAGMKAIQSLMAEEVNNRLKEDEHKKLKGYEQYAKTLRGYHEIINRFETSNSLVGTGIVGPISDKVTTVLRSLDEILGPYSQTDLETATNSGPANADNENAVKKANEKKDKDSKKETKKDDKEKNKDDKGSKEGEVEASNVQLKEEGVPVFVVPTLLENEMAHADLNQRGFIMDGINGFDFVQTKSEGVPVFVNPTLMENEMAQADLQLRGFIMDGINGYDI